MTTITIRDVPEEARDELAARAARSGRSLQEFLRNELVNLSARPDPAELARRIRQRKSTTRTSLAVADILIDLDAERR